MTQKRNIADYNSRLFNTGRIRRFYHMARFDFVADLIKRRKINVEQFLELGCFDGRLLQHIPQPDHYVGIDANVEGGLDLAKKNYIGDSSKVFIESLSPENLLTFESDSFSAFASLETCEHIDPDQLDAYLDEVSRVLDGDLIITVPNEKGPVLLVKKLVKRIIGSRSDPYSLAELFYASIGRMERVARREHKGFDYNQLVDQIDHRFELISVTGLPFQWLPPVLNLTVAIHARSRMTSVELDG